jgi:hypothetical protein
MKHVLKDDMMGYLIPNSLSYPNLFDGDSVIQVSEKNKLETSFKQLVINSPLVRPSDMELLNEHKISCAIKINDSDDRISFEATNVVVYNFQHKHLSMKVKLFDPAWLQV